MVTLRFGAKGLPRPVRRESDADTIWGPAWHAWKTVDGHVLEYATGDIAGRDRRFAITAEEFERLRADPNQFGPVIHAHGG